MEKDIIEISNAEYEGNFQIKIIFSDGLVRIVDFNNFLKSAKNPMTTQFRKEEKFKNFKLEYGDLIWGDYDMCFPIHDLYSGNI